MIWNGLPSELQHKIVKHIPIRHLRTLQEIRPLEVQHFGTSIVLPGLNDLVRAEARRRVVMTYVRFRLAPDSLEAVMRETGMVLSGSAALEITTPGNFTPQDLDFYCPQRAIETVMSYFVNEAGYIDETTPRDRADYAGLGTGIDTVMSLRHSGDPGLKLNVIQSTSMSPHAPILFFHSTVVMNFISCDGIASLYPCLTSQKKGMSPSVFVEGVLTEL